MEAPFYKDLFVDLVSRVRKALQESSPTTPTHVARGPLHAGHGGLFPVGPSLHVESFVGPSADTAVAAASNGSRGAS